MKSPGTAIGGVTLLLLAGAAMAHTTVATVDPADGSQLDASPAVIEIRFEHAVHLTFVALRANVAAERPLEFAPHDSATTFRVEHPNLAVGRNELRWTALSSDGHVISGTLTYRVRAARQPTR
jgi:methionine-rich copper-binding protein CopC